MINKKYFLFFRFLRYILPYKIKWARMLFLSMSAMALTLINPYLAKIAIDDGIGKKDMSRFFTLALIGGGVFVAIGALNSIKNYIEREIRLKLRFDLSRDVFDRINNMHFKWFQDKNTGEHIYKISYDIDRVDDLITNVPQGLAGLLPRLIFIIAIIFYLNWKLALFSLCMALFLYLPSYYFIRKREKIWRVLIRNSEKLFKALHEMFSHVYFMKVFGKEKAFLDRYLRRLKENLKIELDNSKWDIGSNAAAGIMNKAVMGFITLFGGYLVIKNEISLGTFTAIMVYLSQLVGLHGSFIGFFQSIIFGIVSCERVNDILEERPGILEKEVSLEDVFSKGEIVFDKVSFGYSEGRPVLNRLGFNIPGGKHVCIVAASGTGKTTLLNLIIRLYDVWNGSIFIDGMSIKDIKLDSLKGQIGMALQEPFLFDDTIINNVLYGKEDASIEDVIAVSKVSLVDDFVKNLAEGYDTAIGEGACKISEGQKQKIAIARALIKKPKIIILDEAMASMDTVSEDKILTNIKENFKGATLITVSHRLSTVLKADLVYFLKGSGEIVIGEGRDLLQKDKDFSELFKAQLL